MSSLPAAVFLKRMFLRASRAGGFAVAVFALAIFATAVATSGCRSEAQDRNFDFNNPNDPNQDTGVGAGAGTGQIVIASVDSDPGVVLLVNQGIENTDMSSWTLENDNAPPDTYTFSGFTLIAGRFVRIHTEAGFNSGTSTATDIYTDPTALNWGITAPNNVARLKNGGGTTIFTCQVGNTCWN
jgi:hypothetical protein